MSSLESESYSADELGQYSSLSTLAVVAFLLGLCSLLMFVHPLMIVVPLAAVATALMALKGIAASEGGLSGAKLARYGLALAILFSVASFARIKVRDMLLQRQADGVAQQWISLAAEGNSESMLELMSRAAIEKLTPAVEPGQGMPFFGKILSSALIRQDPLVLALSELQGETGQLRLTLEDAGIQAGTPTEAFLRYVANDDGAEPVAFYLMLKRFAGTSGELWFVDSWGMK